MEHRKKKKEQNGERHLRHVALNSWSLNKQSKDTEVVVDEETDIEELVKDVGKNSYRKVKGPRSIKMLELYKTNSRILKCNIKTYFF